LWHAAFVAFPTQWGIYKSYLSISSYIHYAFAFWFYRIVSYRQDKRLPKNNHWIGNNKFNNYNYFLYLQNNQLLKINFMEKRNLPNGTAVLVLGILSIVTCCCYGFIGITLGIIALVLANKDLKLYKESPELYLNYKNLNIGKILGTIGIVLSSIALLLYIYMYSLGPAKLLEIQKNLEAKAKYQQEQNP
jgi:hypothetical protein